MSKSIGCIRRKKVLVISNDSTVFLSNKFVNAFEMCGGRMTEVKKLVERLNTVSDVSFGIISGEFGFIPANYVIKKYDNVPSCKKEYESLQRRKDFVGQIKFITQAFDKVIICVPKNMFEMIIPVLPRGKVIAVTNEKFKDICKENEWSFYLRNGTRVGNENANAIVTEIKKYMGNIITVT